MENLLYIVHGIICLTLILLILLQQGKGAGVGFSMGGASQAMFGGSGGREFFIKLTAGLGIGFVLICIVLAKMATTSAGQYRGALSGVETPAATAPAAAPLGAPVEAPAQAPAQAPAGN
jgi:preprotein translocase subunit SecG